MSAAATRIGGFSGSRPGGETFVFRRLARKVQDLCLYVTPAQWTPKTVMMLVLYGSVNKSFQSLWYDDAYRAMTTGDGWTPAFVRGFARAILAEFSRTCEAAGDPAVVAKLSVLEEYFYPRVGVTNFRSYNPGKFVLELCQEGAFCIVSGPELLMRSPMGVGKTDTLLWIGEQLWDLKEEHLRKGDRSNLARMLADRDRNRPKVDSSPSMGRLPVGLLASNGIRFLTNAPVIEPDYDAIKKEGLDPERAKRIYESFGIAGETPHRPVLTGLKDYALGMIRHSRLGIMSHAMIDELGVAYDRRGAMKRENTMMRQIHTGTRKFNTSESAATQQAGDQLPKEMTGIASTRITKLDKWTGVYTVSGFMIDMRLHDVPRTTIAFRSRRHSNFRINFWLEKLLEYLDGREKDAVANRIEWTDELMFYEAERYVISESMSDAEVDVGKSPVLRMDIADALSETDDRGHPLALETIAKRFAQEYVMEDGTPMLSLKGEAMDYPWFLKRVTEEANRRKQMVKARKIGAPPVRPHPDDDPELKKEGWVL